MPGKTSVVLLILFVGIVLIIGCTYSENPSLVKIPHDNVSVTPINETIGQPSENGSVPFITINPIETHKTGESFLIRGLTNLGTQEKIRISIRQKRLNPPLPYTTYNYTDLEGNISVKNGEFGINTWSFPITMTFPPATYNVSVVGEQNQLIENNSQFFIGYYHITMDDVPLVRDREVALALHGTTDIPGGEIFTLHVIYFSFGGTVEYMPVYEIENETVTVNKGSHGENVWSVTFKPYTYRYGGYNFAAEYKGENVIPQRTFSVE